MSLVTRSVLCSLLVDHYFFAFGHQATVNSLRFEAGFIGIYGDIQSIKLLIAGVLVGLNTLASQVNKYPFILYLNSSYSTHCF